MYQIKLFHTHGETIVSVEAETHEEAYRALFDMVEENDGWVNGDKGYVYTKTKLSSVTYMECIDPEEIPRAKPKRNR